MVAPKIADITHAIRVQTQRNQRMITVDYPLWMNLPAERFDADDIVTANLDNIATATIDQKGVVKTAIATTRSPTDRINARVP